MLRELKLDIHKDKKVTSLSGGQRKRVSVALELLTKPSLIFLDEPTSGLDPGMDRDVMQLLRGLADDGRTVLVVTHSVAELAICDKLLVMAPGGSVAYFGPPEEALNFFGYDTWADVFSAFENYRDYDWAGRWKGSQHYQMYAADIDAVAPQSVHMPPPQSMRPPKPQGWLSQLGTLVRRYVSVIASDKGFLALTVILPAVLGAVSLLIDPDKDLLVRGVNKATGLPIPNGTATTVLLILAVGACFAGAANSVRELIKERVIYERERATGLSRSAYLMSKVIVLGAVTVFQGAMVGAIGFSTRTIPDEAPDLRRGQVRRHARTLHPDHGARLHVHDVRPGHLLAGEDRREDDAAAGHVRDRPGRLHRLPLRPARQPRRQRVLVPDAVALGGRRRGRHAGLQQHQPAARRPATPTRCGTTRSAPTAST